MQYTSNKSGLEELARGPIAQSLVKQYGDAKAAAAGDGFVVSYRQGRTRFGAILYADTYSAKRKEARENVLIRVLG